MSQTCVAAFYNFVPLADFASLRGPMLSAMRKHRILGTILLAPEGINGTVVGDAVDIDGFMAWLRRDSRLGDLELKVSGASTTPFRRRKVKLKREIVSMGIDGIDPASATGQYVEPGDWNALLDDPDMIVIDARNDYEIAIGAFDGAINPQTRHFSELPAWLDQHVAPETQPRIAMYCTGGIRCEKSTAYLRERGIDQVFQLRGGILKYLEEVPRAKSRWSGECFVFDDRVTVTLDLEQGGFTQCHACRMPLSEQDKQNSKYRAGISCPHCFGKTTAEQREGFAEREKQMRLAAARGQRHLAR